MSFDPNRRPNDYAWPILLVIVIAFVVFVRLRIADVPLERDEGEYAYAGQLILQGIPPYQLLYNMKFPGTYYAYSVILATFGQTDRGIRIGLMCVNIATIGIMFFLARRLFNSHRIAAIVAIAYGVLSIDRRILGVFAHATHFVVLAGVAGILVLTHAFSSRKLSRYAWAGLLFGTAVLMKQNGVFFLAFAVTSAILNEMGDSRNGYGDAARRIATLCVSSAIPFASVSAVLFSQGVFGKFSFWTFQYAKEYVSEISLQDAFFVLAKNWWAITRANRLLWIIGLVGGIAGCLNANDVPTQTRRLLKLLFVASLLSICPGFYFRAHYFILMLPVLALLLGVAVIYLEQLLRTAFSPSRARVVSAGLFALSVAVYVAQELDYFFVVTPQQLSKTRYPDEPFVETRDIAQHIMATSSPVDRVGVLGSDPEVYFYANRKSATGYIYMYPLLEKQKYAVRMQHEAIDEIEGSRPKYMLFISPKMWLARSPRDQILDWALRYLDQCYELIGIADIAESGRSNLVWEQDVRSYRPRSQNLIYTYRRIAGISCSVAR